MDFLVNKALSMPHLLQMPWLWLFGAVSLGIIVGWLTYLPAASRRDDRVAHIAIGAVGFGILLMVARAVSARYGDRLELGLVLAVVSAVGCYLLATSRWNERPLDIAIGAVAVTVVLVIAKVVPARYGYRLELAVILAIFGAIGCLVGWALRNLAEFTPATIAGATTPAAVSGSYLFRDAHAGSGTAAPYMRAAAGHGSPAPMRTMAASAYTATLEEAPAPGGYTFPKALPFADATRSGQSAPTTGARRHWTWPA